MPASPAPDFFYRHRRVPALLGTALVVLLGLVATSLPPSSAQLDRTADGASSRARADEVSLFPERTPRRVTKDRDRRAVEVGTQFRASVAGTVTGVQVFKIADAKGATPRRASLWNRKGKRLATARITPYDRAGWISVRFSSPVEIVAERTYTVSVHAPKGRPAITERGLRKPRTKGALSTGGEQVGVYRYGKTSTFPTRTWHKSNYWVDATFVPSEEVADPQPELPTNTAWPNENNTGVPTGTTLSRYNGPMRITTPGTVIDAMSISGTLVIDASDVSVIKSSIEGNVTVESGNLTITDTMIDAGNREGTGLEAGNYVATRVHVIGGNRSMYCEMNCTIRDSYVHGQMLDPNGDAGIHMSGIRMEQKTTLIHNTLVCDSPRPSCSASLTGYGDFAPVRDNLIQNNLFLPSTGSACAYGGASAGKPYSDQSGNIRFIDNVFSRGTNGKCGVYFPVTDWNSSAPGNVWEGNTWDDGRPLRP